MPGTIGAALAAAARATPPFDAPVEGAPGAGAGDGEAFGVWEAFQETVTETTPERDIPSHSDGMVHERDEPSVIRERGSAFERVFLDASEFWNSSVEEFTYTARIVRESWGLLLLLGGGVATMVMALVTGLDDVTLPKALTASVLCYGVTTLLVARSVRRTVTLRLLRSGGGAEAAGRGLSSAEVARIVDAVPEEEFVPNDELEGCDASRLEAMLRNRPSGGADRKRAGTTAEDGGRCTPAKGGGSEKERRIADLRRRRKCDAACPICLSAFVRGERIRVLPRCHHEFHSGCIAEWAGTFAVAANGLGPRGADRCVKRGGPTCPLCKTCIGEARDALPAEPSTRYEP